MGPESCKSIVANRRGHTICERAGLAPKKYLSDSAVRVLASGDEDSGLSIKELRFAVLRSSLPCCNGEYRKVKNH